MRIAPQLTNTCTQEPVLCSLERGDLKAAFRFDQTKKAAKSSVAAQAKSDLINDKLPKYALARSFCLFFSPKPQRTSTLCVDRDSKLSALIFFNLRINFRYQWVGEMTTMILL